MISFSEARSSLRLPRVAVSWVQRITVGFPFDTRTRTFIVGSFFSIQNFDVYGFLDSVCNMATGTDTRESFDVNVKDFQGHSVVIKVTPTWDVARVKQEISRHTHVSPRNFKLVFAGQTLAETLTLWVGWWV